MSMVVLGSRDVADIRLPSIGPSARAGAASSPGEWDDEIELPGPTACQLELALFRVATRKVAGGRAAAALRALLNRRVCAPASVRRWRARVRRNSVQFGGDR